MGFAIARAAAEAGAKTLLISGPVNLETPARVERQNVESANDMLEAALEAALEADIFIGAAAVADYRAETVADQKIKKSGETLHLTLVRNPDIIARVAGLEARPHLAVGFAAETQNLIEHAQAKCSGKGLDLVIANDVSRTDIGFNSEHNAVTLIESERITELPMATKPVIASQLIAHMAEALARKALPEGKQRQEVASSEVLR